MSGNGTRPPDGAATGGAPGAVPRIGVLALQGDFALHRRALERVGATVLEVRRPAQLDGLDGLVLPGGESSAMLRLMDGTDMEAALAAFHGRGGALFGTCAGLILLARTVTDPAQRSLGLLDVDVRRNGFGRQIDSFETDLGLRPGGDFGGVLGVEGGNGDPGIAGDDGPLRGVFIRAPRISRVGPEVEVLARFQDEPILVRQGRILAATFHPEATDDLRIHRLFTEGARHRHGVPAA